MIDCNQLGFSYRLGNPILESVSFSLPRGSFHFLAGASGSGKTTLLKMLSLSLMPTQGELRMLGRSITREPRDGLPYLRRRIGVVSQDFQLLKHLTVEQNVALPLKIAGENEAGVEEKVAEMLEWIGLAQYAKVKPEVLSGGQQQRVAIARAVINKPDILLADEPTANLDSQIALRIIYLFEALNQMGTSVLIATHDEHMISLFNYPVLRLSNHTVTLHPPTAMGEGDPSAGETEVV